MSTVKVEPGRHVSTAHLRLRNGKLARVEASGRTAAGARANLTKRLEARRDADGGGSEITGATTIAQLANVYVEALPDLGHSVQTRVRYRRAAEKVITPALGQLSLSEATSGRVASWLDGLAKVRLGDARTSRVVLKAMFGLAVRRGGLQRNPVVDAAVRMPASKKPVRALDARELLVLHKLLASYIADAPGSGPHPTTDITDGVVTMLTTSARIGEALAIRREDLDVDPTTGAVSVTLCGTLVYDEDGKLVRQPHGKSDASTRTVTVPASVGQMLLFRARATRSREGLLFTTRSGTPVAMANWRRTFRSILSGSELEWVTPHSLRKTAATIVAGEFGVSVASRLLGHTSEAITEAAYIAKTRAVADVTHVTGKLLA